MDELSKAALACVIAKWILVENKKASEAVPIWSQRITLDSTFYGHDKWIILVCGVDELDGCNHKCTLSRS